MVHYCIINRKASHVRIEDPMSSRCQHIITTRKRYYQRYTTRSWKVINIPKPHALMNDRTKFNVPHKLEYKNGYPFVKANPVGIGSGPLDVESVRYVKNPAPGLYDPALTYGKCRRVNIPPFKPRFVQYDKKCLCFKGYFTQEVPNSPDEKHRVRKIELIYFLEDDTLLVREPAVENAGFPQGRLVTRGKILKDDGQPFHWKDINNGIMIPINGTEYHLCSCDHYTREYLERHGIEVEPDADVPEDPYTTRRTMQNKAGAYVARPPPDRYTKFLMYDKKVLRFTGIWDNRACEYGDLEEYHILYYPEDDTMEILKRSRRRETETTAPLLARIKVPKNWKKLRAIFPAESLENFYEHRDEMYLPHDLLVGKTIDVFGRKIHLVDCDNATRIFYDKVLQITQPAPLPRVEVEEPETMPRPPQVPRDESREDILPEWHKFTPQPPKTDLVCYLTNMNKLLRYSAKLDIVHPEDEGRRFIIEYRLSDGFIKIVERKLKNTGFQGGKFLGYQLVPKPHSNPQKPEFYSPMDFELGGTVNVFGHRFIITGADLAVYRYMQENTEKFKPETIRNMYDYLITEGLLDPPEGTNDIQEVKPAVAYDADCSLGQENVESNVNCQKKCRFAE